MPFFWASRTCRKARVGEKSSKWGIWEAKVGAFIFFLAQFLSLTCHTFIDVIQFPIITALLCSKWDLHHRDSPLKTKQRTKTAKTKQQTEHMIEKYKNCDNNSCTKSVSPLKHFLGEASTQCWARKNLVVNCGGPRDSAAFSEMGVRLLFQFHYDIVFWSQASSKCVHICVYVCIYIYYVNSPRPRVNDEWWQDAFNKILCSGLNGFA